MTSALENWFFDQPEPNRSCLLALRQLILDHDQHMKMAYKWGGPFFYYQGKVCCYLWIDKKTMLPYVAFYEGKHLNNPALEWGGRTRIKSLAINPNADLPVKLLNKVLKDALDLYRNGIVKLRQ